MYKLSQHRYKSFIKSFVDFNFGLFNLKYVCEVVGHSRHIGCPMTRTSLIYHNGNRRLWLPYELSQRVLNRTTDKNVLPYR